MQANESRTGHVPVLAEALAEQINLPGDGVMVDATIGHAGHSLLFGEMLGPKGLLVGFDVDEAAIQEARLRLEGLKCKVVIVHANFGEIVERLGEQEVGEVDFILADLGVCSAQLADGQMGLSYQADMLLDMRLDKRLRATAADIVNSVDERSLADLIYRYGEDRASRRIARFIVRQRRRQPITTTGQLADVVCRALGQGKPKRRPRRHPATRTFQALRIAVNHELENLQRLLDAMPGLLRAGGYAAVISFHSLEDRLVKHSFARNQRLGLFEVLTKKPIRAGPDEIARNRRARSAKLRIAQRQG